MDTNAISGDYGSGRTDFGSHGFSGSGASGGLVPESATWALMLGGFGLAGAALRRQRTAVTA